MNKKEYLLILLTLFITSSCYKDFTIQEYDFTSVYFNKTELPRTIVAEEGLQLKAAVHRSGDLKLKKSVNVKFEVAEDLISSGTKYIPLPTDYYTITPSDGNLVIPKGEESGNITIKLDPEKVKNDPKLLSNKANDGRYAVALRIVETSNDSINAKLATQIIPIQYINTYEGNYYSIFEYNKAVEGGSTETIKSGDMIDYVKAGVRSIKTTSYNEVVVTGIADKTDLAYKYNLKINDDNSVIITPVASSPYQVAQNGDCKWNPVKRYYTLNYKFTTPEGENTVSETMIFRDRNRDGKSEWRWLGFAGN